MTPDDEAAWEAFYVNPDAVTFTRAEVRAAFMAGRVSGRADAAAQALTDAEAAVHDAEMSWGDGPGGYYGAMLDHVPLDAWLAARAAQYREKGNDDADTTA